MNIWDHLTRVVIILIVVACLLGVGIWYLPVIKQNQRMRQETQRLDAQVQKEEEAAKQLKSSIEAMRNDPQTVERVARQKLGYAKPGETVVRFEGATTNTPAAARP
jgi:cell division protein FtsB